MLDVIERRRSIREYSSRRVENDKLTEIVKAAQFAPSARAIRPWQFWIIQDEGQLQELGSLARWGSFIAQAPAAIVITVDENASDEWIEDGALAGAHIYLEATNQGLGTCWVQVRGKPSEDDIKEQLDIPDNLRVLAVFPIGYPDEEKRPHTEDGYEPEKVHFDKEVK